MEALIYRDRGDVHGIIVVLDEISTCRTSMEGVSRVKDDVQEAAFKEAIFFS